MMSVTRHLARLAVLPAVGIAVALAVVACGDKIDPEAKATCEQAADRYQACIREMLGPEMEATVAAKRDITSCARDPRTVAMYERCLPKASCDELMDCMMGEAAKGP